MPRNKLMAAFAPLMLLAGAATAQTPPAKKPAATAAAPSGPTLGGPAVPGVCLLSQEQLVATSKVGQAAVARLRQLAGLAQQEINADRSGIESDDKALQSQIANLKPADVESRRQLLQSRVQQLQEKAQLRDREVQATQQKAFARVMAEARPALAQVYRAHRCGLLLNRNSVLDGNMSGDLTVEVVKGLDAKVTTITFDREILTPGK